MEDPFYTVKAEVKGAIGKAEGLVARHAELRRAIGPAAEVQALRANVEAVLEDVTADLEDLEAAIVAVERQRERFKIDDAELESRRSFVASTRAHVASLGQQLDSTAVAVGGGSGLAGHDSPPENASEKAGLLGGGGGRGARPGAGGAREAAAGRDLEGHACQQQLEMRAQDEALEGLSSIVGRLKQQGEMMNEELVSQGNLLESLSSQVESAAASMQSLKGKMAKLVASKDGKHLCAISVLTIVLFLLIYAVLS